MIVNREKSKFGIDIIRLFKSFSPIIYSITLIFIYSVRNPNWFTTYPISIDAWIYWGAGDNPQLSYSNGFQDTYYLQRYVLIGPQILFQSFLGPYWSQLGISLFWLLITLTSIWLISKNRFVYLGVATTLILDRTFMGSFGMSYTQAPSTALMLASLASICIGIDVFESNRKGGFRHRSFFVLSGLIAGCLVNAYSAMASIFIPSLMLSYLIITRAKLTLREAIKTLVDFTLGISIISLAIQCFYMAKFNTQNIILLQQFNLGQNLLRHKNSWGGEAGINAFYSKLTVDFLFHWWLGALIFVAALLLLRINSSFKKLNSRTQLLILYSISSSFMVLSFHLTYSYPVAYSWGAIIMIIPEIIGICLLLHSYTNYLSTKKKISVIISFVVLVNYISYKEGIVRGEFTRELVAFSLIMLLLILFQLLWRSKSKNQLQLLIAFSFFLLLLTLLALRSSYLASAGDLAGAGKNAKSIYSEISDQRNILVKLKDRTNSQYRIWLTPENSTPLVSSMLFAYSLISTEPGRSQCSQVKWAASSKAIIGTFVQSQEIGDIERNYLADCGYELVELDTGEDFKRLMVENGFKFGVLHRVS